ncbi:MAG: Na/Pi cotransporter family protein [Deltaproteobacteria bacterium]|nr:Na/Pi cotransporter family protein [Deltaproteobacteria bacterium]
MMESIDIWKLIAGLGVFLFGMHHIEASLKELGGRSLKLSLRKYTQRPLSAILVGTVATAILQSSSVVSLIVMAFVGAGIISTKNALGIIFGSNLGTTFTGWIVATIGFKLNLENFYLPVLALSSLGFVFFQKQSRARLMSQAFLGLSFLLMGLVLMKTSTELIAQNIDISWLSGYPLFVFLIFGALLTALIQSSSATVMITLTALHTELITFPAACALVIGANLGTTITAVLGSIKGTSDKKRVALAHVLFNVVTDILAFLMIVPWIYFIQDVLKISEPLYALVAFHSLFNLMGIIVFIPWIKSFSRFLEKRFHSRDESTTKFLHKVVPEIPEAALIALRSEVRELIVSVMKFNVKTFHIEGLGWEINKSHDYKLLSRYQKLKEVEGEILNFSIQLQTRQLKPEDSKKLETLILAARHAVHSSKCVKDIGQNLVEFRNSTSSHLMERYQAIKNFLAQFYRELLPLLELETLLEQEVFEDLLRRAQNFHDEYVKETYSMISQKAFSDVEISTILNVNREIFSANKALIAAIQSLNGLNSKDSK